MWKPRAALKRNTFPFSWCWSVFPSQVIVWEPCLFHVIRVNSHLVTMEKNWVEQIFKGPKWRQMLWTLCLYFCSYFSCRGRNQFLGLTMLQVLDWSWKRLHWDYGNCIHHCWLSWSSITLAWEKTELKQGEDNVKRWKMERLNEK